MGVCLARFVLRFRLVCVIAGWVCLFRADFLAVLRVGVGCCGLGWVFVDLWTVYVVWLAFGVVVL